MSIVLYATANVDCLARFSVIVLAISSLKAMPDWEVRDILGKKVVDGRVHYLVDWRPTLVLEDVLGNAKELVDEFEARLRTQRESQNGKAVEVASQGGEISPLAVGLGTVPHSPFGLSRHTAQSI